MGRKSGDMKRQRDTKSRDTKRQRDTKSRDSKRQQDTKSGDSGQSGNEAAKRRSWPEVHDMKMKTEARSRSLKSEKRFVGAHH